jgi:hypothetical protein
MTRGLGRTLQGLQSKPQGHQFHVGYVQSIQRGAQSTLTILFSANTNAVSGISFLSSYSPQVGDYVMATHTGSIRVQGGGDWFVWGTVGGTRAIFRGYVGSAYNLSTGGSQKLPLSVASIDTASGFSSANSWYVVPTAGYYRVSGAILGAAVNPNILGVSIYWNGASASVGGQTEAGSSANYGLSVADILTCAAGDTIALWAYSTSGGALVIGSEFNYLAVSPA